VRLAKGDRLVKGGKKVNSVIWAACENVRYRFVCYYWRSDGKLKYVGCTSKDYKDHSGNLLGRMANYLQNHREGATNKNVFDAVNLLLEHVEVEFGRFHFDSCKVGDRLFTYDQVSGDGDLTYMIENLLIGFYKSKGQCEWNR